MYNTFIPLPTMCFSQSQRSLLPTFIYQEQEFPWTTSKAFFLENSNTNFSYSPCETFPRYLYRVWPEKQNALTSLDNGHIMFMSFITNLYVYTMYILRFLFNLNNLERFCILDNWWMKRVIFFLYKTILCTYIIYM